MNKILIRPLRFEDASVSWKWRNDPEVWEHTGSRPDIVVTEEIEKQWIVDKLKELNSVRFAIDVDDVYVGNIQLTNIVENETAEYHVFIGDKSYWGKGVASLATSQIIRFAKNVINLQSIYLSVKPENKSAIRVYEKSGFVKINEDVKMTLDLSKVNTPLVSVFMMAYNHEKYIAEAIEGVLMQKTSFDFDIVIGEDCSTDNTRQIILDYQQKHPGKFKLLLHEENIGAMANQMAVLQACTGKFIAMCEGDDYWTDPYKLQKQVDFLEKNKSENVIAVVTNCSTCDLNGKLTQDKRLVIPPNNDPGIYNLHDFFKNNHFYPTLTIMFSSKYLNWIAFETSKLSNPFFGDWILFVLLHSKGNFGYIDEVTAAYRINPNSVTHTANAVNRWKSDFTIRKKLMKVLEKKYHAYLKSNYYSYFMIGMAYRKQKNNFLFLLYQFISLLTNPVQYFRLFSSITKKQY